MSLVQHAITAAFPQRPRPFVGRVGVMFYLGEEAKVQRAARRLFGRPLGLGEYAGLAGAPDGACVELGTLGGHLYLETRDPAARLFRAIHHLRPDRAGPVLVIDAFHVFARRMRGQGLGLGVFGRQLTFARRLGAGWIETRAGRCGDENGYYTWPRFGFDGVLPAAILRTLLAELCNARRLVDLFACDHGRRWWRRHGITLDVVFDLAPESRSWAAFTGYVLEKSSPAGPIAARISWAADALPQANAVAAD